MSSSPPSSSNTSPPSVAAVAVAIPQGNADVRVEVSGTYKRLVDAVDAQRKATAELLIATERIDKLAQNSEMSRATFAQIKSLKEVLKKLTEVNSTGNTHSGADQLNLIAHAAEQAMQHVFEPKSKNNNNKSSTNSSNIQYNSNGVPVRKESTSQSVPVDATGKKSTNGIPGLSGAVLSGASGASREGTHRKQDKEKNKRDLTSSNTTATTAPGRTSKPTVTTSDSTGISQVSDMMLNMASFPQLIVLLRKQVDTVEERTTEGSKNVLRILARLRDLIPDITEKLLRTTHAGLLVAQLKRDPSTRISELAKYLVKVWKAIVLEDEKKKAQASSSKNSSQSQTSSKNSSKATAARGNGSSKRARVNDKAASSSSRGGSKSSKSNPVKSSGAGAVKRFVRGGGDASFENDRALFRERQEKEDARNKIREREQRSNGGERKGRIAQRSDKGTDRDRMQNRNERERGRGGGRKRSRSISRSPSRSRSRERGGGRDRGGKGTNKKKKGRNGGSSGGDNEADFDEWMNKRRAQMRGSFERVQYEEERSAQIGLRDDRNAVL